MQVWTAGKFKEFLSTIYQTNIEILHAKQQFVVTSTVTDIKENVLLCIFRLWILFFDEKDTNKCAKMND